MSSTQSLPAISHDLPCITCGYNLRTLSPTSLCPECAAPVSHSLRPAFLDANPRWITQLLWATRLTSCLPPILWMPLLMWFAPMSVILISFTLVYASGLWLLAANPAPIRIPQSYRILRIIVRLIATGLILAFATAIIALIFNFFNNLISFYFLGLLISGMLCSFLLWSQIARLILDHSLVRRALIEACLTPTLLLIAVLFAWLHIYILALICYGTVVLTSSFSTLLLGRFFQLLHQSRRIP